jgi:hypothetical protein
MKLENLLSFRRPDYARLFLDLPYRHGIEHIRQAVGLDQRIQDCSKRLEVDPPTRFSSLKSRTLHLILGIAECLPVIGIIVTFVAEYFLKLPLKEGYGEFIEPSTTLLPHQQAWDLNLAVLRKTYDRAQGKRKKQIQFLAANFLAKVTPKILDGQYHRVKSFYPDYRSSQQASPFECYGYHREFLFNRVEFAQSINVQLAFGEDSLFILTDTLEIDDILSVGYHLLSGQFNGTCSDLIYEKLKKHFDEHGLKGLEQNLDKGLLLDLSSELGSHIQCGQDKQKQQAFAKEWERFQRLFKYQIDLAIERLVEDHSGLADKKEALKKLVERQVTCISKVEVEGTCGIKMIPMGLLQKKNDQFSSAFAEFMIHTGLCIGAINLRRRIFDPFAQRAARLKSGVLREIEKSLYPRAQAFLKSPVFQAFCCDFSGHAVGTGQLQGVKVKRIASEEGSVSKKPHFHVLGKATADLLEGLLLEMNVKGKWDELQSDPIAWELVQHTLYFISLEMTRAQKKAKKGDFEEFAQSIEIIHSHLATLLELSEPFEKDDFNSIYREKLLGHSVPKSLEKYLRAGLSKAAVNVFAGVIAAVKDSKKAEGLTKEVESVKAKEAYFEQAFHLKHDCETLLKSPPGKPIDLYHGQFNTNVNVGSEITEYRRIDLARDIRELLNRGYAAKHLTVAIDITIDDFNSGNVHGLLRAFEKEIKEGKLNFVFFQSGQKFYNMGMDNYYGAPFYVVNNQAAHWKAFNELGSRKSLEIDHLSRGWFCLCTKYASDSLEAYRQLVFKNTRHVLDRIPASLLPGAKGNQVVRVNKVFRDMAACFIDLKVVAPAKAQEKLSDEIYLRFFRKMAAKKIMAYSRASFGFYHQNFAVFGHLDDKVRTVRLNPGINPEENEALVEFFEELSQEGTQIALGRLNPLVA